jgi:hypothetical protein
VGGWDSEAELSVDGQVGTGPSVGAGGKAKDLKAGGPGLYMIEPSGLYWVGNPTHSLTPSLRVTMTDLESYRATTVQQLAKDDKQRKQNSRNSISPQETSASSMVSRRQLESSTLRMKKIRISNLK